MERSPGAARACPCSVKAGAERVRRVNLCYGVPSPSVTFGGRSIDSKREQFRSEAHRALATPNHEVTAVHSTIWLLLFIPPCFAFVVWQIVRSSPRVGFPSIPFGLGRHGFWTVLTITYVSMFVVALIEHKL